jgi:gamma-glutamylcyclotransferase (GGCT)/AIG2-like uncharacterized protein YtfP
MAPVSLFAYGTLMDPKKRLELLGREVEAEDAVLRGYGVVLPPPGFFGYEDECDRYPVAVPRGGGVVRGKLLRVTEEELKRLDEWEDTPRKVYARREVWVETTSGRRLRAFAYVARNKV